MTERSDDKTELPWAKQKVVLREIDWRNAGVVPKALKSAVLRKNGGLSALAILKAGAIKDLRARAGNSTTQVTANGLGKQESAEQTNSKSNRKKKAVFSIHKWMIRRVRRLWSSWVMKLLDMKFPTFFAHLSRTKREEIRAILQPGDILLEDNSSYLLSQFGARLIHSAWSHSGVYTGDGKIIDCGSRPYVAEVGLDEFLNTSDIAVYRPRYQTEADLQSALSFVKACLDRPFNRNFNLNSENSFYCTQLIYRALKQMPRPINLSVSQVMRKSVILASAVEECPDMQLIWVSRNGFVKGCLAHLPSVIATALGVYCMNLFCPALDIFGGILGLTFVLTAENLYQRDTQPNKSLGKDLSKWKLVKADATTSIEKL